MIELKGAKNILKPPIRNYDEKQEKTLLEKEVRLAWETTAKKERHHTIGYSLPESVFYLTRGEVKEYEKRKHVQQRKVKNNQKRNQMELQKPIEHDVLNALKSHPLL